MIDRLKQLAAERDRLDQDRAAITDEIRATVEAGRREGLAMTAMAKALGISRQSLYEALERKGQAPSVKRSGSNVAPLK